MVREHRFNRAAPRQKLPHGAQLGLGGRSSGWGVGSSACAVSAPVTIRRSDVPHAAEPDLGVAKGRSSAERTRRCHGFAKRFVSRPAAHAASGSPFLREETGGRASSNKGKGRINFRPGRILSGGREWQGPSSPCGRQRGPHDRAPPRCRAGNPSLVSASGGNGSVVRPWRRPWHRGRLHEGGSRRFPPDPCADPPHLRKRPSWGTASLETNRSR